MSDMLPSELKVAEGLVQSHHRQLEAELAAVRFSEREWRSKAQDKIAEVVDLEETLGAVAALAMEWRRRGDKNVSVHWHEHADELEAILSSTPPR